MALGALSREEPDAAAPGRAEKPKQGRTARLNSFDFYIQIRCDARWSDPNTSKVKHHMNPDEPGKSFGIRGRITIHKGLEHLNRRNSDNRSQDFLFEPWEIDVRHPHSRMAR